MSSSSTFSGEAEQRRLGENGVDVIDEFCEASIFDEAAKYLTRTKLKLSNDEKLTFYALFKQATIGPCNTQKPSMLSIYERTKWNSWNDLGKMSKDEAISRYVAELERVAPSWAEQAGVVTAAESDEEDASSDNGAGGAMTMPQSRPVAEEEVAIADLSPDERTIWFWAGQGDIEQVRACLQRGVDVNGKDDEGRTALHWAVDRAHYSLVEALLTELGAAVNACDVDGATSLHYAALCEHAPLVSLLLVHGADPTIADDGGDTAADAIRSMKDATPVMIAILDKCKSKSD